MVRLQEKLTTEGGVAQVTMELSDKREAEVARLKKEAEVREEEAKEVSKSSQGRRLDDLLEGVGLLTDTQLNDEAI